MKVIFTFLLAICYVFCQGQEYQDSTLAFLKGVRLSDSVFIPWGVEFKQLRTYGNPVIGRYKNKKQRALRVLWDSAEILPGIKVLLFANEVNFGLGFIDSLNRVRKTNEVICYMTHLDQEQFKKLKNELFRRFGVRKTNYSFPFKYYGYSWKISNISLTLAYNRPNKYYFLIRKESP